jgi:hypothetical protein
MSTDDTVGDKRHLVDISNQQLETIVQDKDAKTTRRSTDQAVRLIRKYFQVKERDPAFESYDKQTLDNKLCKLYAEARTVDGEFCKNSSLRTTRHGLNKYLGSIFDADLTKDAESRESENVCFVICTDLKGQGFVGVDHHPPVDDSDMRKMYQHFHLSNPKSLQWRVLCCIMLYFGRRGQKILENLKLLILVALQMVMATNTSTWTKIRRNTTIKMMKIQLPVKCMKSKVCNNKI